MRADEQAMLSVGPDVGSDFPRVSTVWSHWSIVQVQVGHVGSYSPSKIVGVAPSAIR